MNWLFYTTDQWLAYLDYITYNNLLPAVSTVLVTTGNTALNSNQLTSLAATTGVLAGHAISGTGIATGAYVLEISGTTVTMSQPSTGAFTTTAVTFSHEYAGGTTVQAQLDELDAAASRNRPFDLTVGSGTQCDYASLTALAAAQSAIGSSKRIYVLDSETITSTVTFSEDFWTITCAPGVTLTNSSAGTAISAAARGLNFEGLRFVGFTTGIAFTSAGIYGRVLNCYFNTTTTDIDDSAVAAGKKPYALANHDEI